jgi:hypothetical protein
MIKVRVTVVVDDLDFHFFFFCGFEAVSPVTGLGLVKVVCFPGWVSECYTIMSFGYSIYSGMWKTGLGLGVSFFYRYHLALEFKLTTPQRVSDP